MNCKISFVNDTGLWLFLVLILYSCAPKITSFTASPAAITKNDSVVLNWKIKGTPTLMYNQRKISRPGSDSLDVLEFTLSVKKGKKEKHVKRQISLLTNESSDNVVLATNDVKGDTLIAEGIKDTELWSNFEIISVSSASHRSLIVLHDNIQGALDSSGTTSNAWEGTPYSGTWKIMTQLTEAEKKDSTIIPGRLEINALIRSFKK
ncbi:MAG: hypothetical protein ABI374_09520 [Ginsengibacter sp.]